MSLDRITQDAYFREISPRIVGHRIEKIRPHGKSALRAELSSRDALFLDVSRSAAGIWLLTRSTPLAADLREVQGPSRTATLLFKKHLEGARVSGIEATPSRDLILRTSNADVVLHAAGTAFATLLLGGEAMAVFGVAGSARAPVPVARETADASTFMSALHRATRDERRAILLDRDPGLLPLLRHWPSIEIAAECFASVYAGDRAPEPFISPPLRDDAAHAAVPPALIPFDPGDGTQAHAGFENAAALLYVAHRRADMLREKLHARTARARAEVQRLTRLRSALERDRGRWPDPETLRRHAEALLASGPGQVEVAKGRDAVHIEIPDPRGEASMSVLVHPSMTLPQNANALFKRARATEKQRTAFEDRWAGVLSGLNEAEETLARMTTIRLLDELEETDDPAPKTSTTARPRYLTSRGLEMMFGRSASENHDVTFKLAKREDIWFHVLDAPGGHVILRNRDGRANREDIAQAAGLAAFLSERRTESQVDVQYTERKHVHPAGGGKGRVRVAHSEVIRVAPQDPSGRLRER